MTLANRLVRQRRWVALVWVLAAALLIPQARHVEERLDVAARAEGSESAAVERMLGERFGSPFARYAVLVLSGVPGPNTDAGRAVLERAAGVADSVPGVSRTFSYLDAADSLFVGAETAGGALPGTFLVAGLDPNAVGARAPDALVPALRAATARLADSLRATYPRAELAWTGEIPLNVDLRRTSAADAEGAERRVLPLTLALLLLAFGALGAALLPVAAGGFAIALTLGAASLAATRWPLSILLQNVVSMLGLGLGIDYALLTVSRFREARARGLDAEAAATEAARTAGHTILLSAAAVAVGFAGLLAVPLSEMRSVAVGGLVVVTVSALLATTLLPGVLASLGDRVDAGRIRRRRTPARSSGAESGAGWRRWGRWVAARPALVLALTLPALLALGAQARRLETRLPRGDWLPPGMESARGLHALAGMGRSGVVQAVRVVLELPPGTRALDDAGWAATRRLSETLGADRRVARVRSLPALGPLAEMEAPSSTLLSVVPSEVLRTFVSRDGRAALLEVMPREAASPGELSSLVRELRAADAGRLTGLPGAALRVGGLPAFNADYEDAIARRTPLVVGLILAGTFVALCAGFRSLLVPLKAVALNLLSVAAAFGAVVLVFQDGHGARLVGLAAPLDGVFPAVPLLVFCIVFGLSMDYEVFLVARVAEARRAPGATESDALAEGMARTGGVITSAALIMVAVFAAFTLGGFVLMKILGFALAVAVLLDVTVVRAAVGPALLALAGRWNWWPGDRPRRAATRPRGVLTVPTRETSG